MPGAIADDEAGIVRLIDCQGGGKRRGPAAMLAPRLLALTSVPERTDRI